MKRLQLLFILLFTVMAVKAQVPDFDWASSAGGSSSDYMYGFTTDAAGNSYVTGKFKSDPMDFGSGITISPYGNYDIYLAKYDASGSVVWAVRDGSAGSSSPDEGRGVAVDADGNVLATGAFFGTAYFGDGVDSITSSGNFDAYFAKYDGNGNFVWVKQVKGSSQDKGTCVTVDGQGNYIWAGYFGDDGGEDTLNYDGNVLNGYGERAIYVIKTDANGNFIWGATAGSDQSGNEVYGIDVDPYNNIYISGYFKDTCYFGGTTLALASMGSYDAFIAKLDPNGNFTWAEQFGGTGKQKFYGIDYFTNSYGDGTVASTGYSEDTAYVAGVPYVSAGDDDLFGVGLNPDGVVQGAIIIGGEAEEHGRNVKGREDGTIFVTAYAKGDVIVAGDTLHNVNKKDAFLYVFNPETDFETAAMYGGESDDYLKGIGFGTDEKVYFGAQVKSPTITFPPFDMTNAGSYDIDIMQMTFPTASHPSNLFFSEYVEGSGNNKALEIYNNSDEPVDLTQYVILGSYNGSGWTNVCNFPAGSVVAPHDVWVIVNSGADIIDFSVADEVLAYNDSSYVVGFNGDDARAIAQINGSDTTIYDVIGIANEDPGSGWDVAGITNATKDHTLRRKQSISQGNSDWTSSAGSDADNSEWEVLDKNTVDGLGWFIEPSTVNVTFQVDMSVQAMLGKFDPDSNVVTIPGDFDNWLNEPPANTDKVLDDSDGDLIYTKTFELDPNTSYQYKYNIGLGWDGNDELQGEPNRVIETGTTDTTLAPVFFDNQSIGGTAIVTFEVDMSLKAQTDFNPATQDVYVAGNFTDWGTNAIIMSDADGDSTYSVTVDTLTGGETLFFKFIYGDQGSTEYTWETVDNREFTPIDGENDYFAYWDNVEPGQNFADGNITFNVDMSVMTEVGVFDNAVDSVQVRGSFNGWGNSDPMDQNFLDPNQWFRTVSFTQEVVGTDEAYKFYANLADTSTMWTDGWERPFSQGGGNRNVAFEGTTDQTVDPVYYDDVNPDWVIPAGTTVSITFSVDMTDAANDQIQVPTFNPATDTVWWIAEEPAFTYNMGWVDRDDMREVMLTDSDGDMVYTVTLQVTGPAWNGFEYRYGFSNGDFHAEPAGFSAFAYRVRYIGMTGARAFIQPWDAPQDHWTPQEDKSDQWEAEPTTTGVGDGTGTVKRFELSQNYPNPFNPTTTIKFAIPQSSEVTLNVYNLLGQKVATLINAQMDAGSYEYHFDASRLGSGVYFYSIKAGKYSDTKKMILMK